MNEDLSDTRPQSFLLSPLHFSDEDDEEGDITPVPPRDDQKTPTEFSLNFQLHTNTPEAENIRIEPMEKSCSKMAKNESTLNKRNAKLVEEHNAETDEHAGEVKSLAWNALFHFFLGEICNPSFELYLALSIDELKKKIIKCEYSYRDINLQRIDYLMDKLFFEELGVVPEQLKGGVSPNLVRWYPIYNAKKYKKNMQSIFSKWKTLGYAR